MLVSRNFLAGVTRSAALGQPQDPRRSCDGARSSPAIPATQASRGFSRPHPAYTSAQGPKRSFVAGNGKTLRSRRTHILQLPVTARSFVHLTMPVPASAGTQGCLEPVGFAHNRCVVGKRFVAWAIAVAKEFFANDRPDAARPTSGIRNPSTKPTRGRGGERLDLEGLWSSPV